MRDIGERKFESGNKNDDLWWFKGMLLVALACIIAAYFLAQRSFSLEYAAVGRPTLGELVQRDKTREQLMLEDHYRYNSYETYSEDDRKGLVSIIMGGE
tara:strand:+ start:10774 stop:11070 length:297 start_codon:yes stop_codon:yes gene_type:complete